MFGMRGVAKGNWRQAWMALFAMFVTACGGSGSDTGTTNTDSGQSAMACDPTDSSTANECGTLLISITDAQGDIVSYSIELLSLSLRRADGTVVETLPGTTRIDFAQLTDLSELLSAATLVPGEYVGGTMRLDYGNAEVFVESGGAIVQADVVDREGAALGIVSVDVDLAADSHLRVFRGSVAVLSLDFDLAMSHEVDTSTSPARVIAEPLFVAEIVPVEQKDIRVRGSLVDVDVPGMSYDVHLQPWQIRDRVHGTVTVHTTPETVYEIGDMMYTGAPGIEALADLERGPLTVAFGSLDVATRTFTADIVLARDSVGGDLIDAVHGNIVARSGDLLTVKGALILRRSDRARFRRTVFVEVGPNTHVLRLGDRDTTLSINNLSVGQRIVALGEFEALPVDDTDASADFAPILDATDGRVRMHATHLRGTVLSAAPEEIVMNVWGIDRLGIDLFDFTGTGPSAGDDADPTHYEISTGLLPLDVIEAGQSAEVIGFVAPFGAAPPDFDGHSVIGPRDLRAVLGLGWGVDGTALPFAASGDEGLLIDLDNSEIGSRHHILIGFRLFDLFDFEATPFVAPAPDRGLYTLAEPDHIELFTSFADFLDALELRLAEGDMAISMAAWGAYDEPSNQLTAKHISVLTRPAIFD
jgi:hypothetical protein